MLLSQVVVCNVKGQQAIVLRELIDRGSARGERLVDILWGDDPNGGPLDIQRNVVRIVSTLRLNLCPKWRIVVGQGRYWLARTTPTMRCD